MGFGARSRRFNLHRPSPPVDGGGVTRPALTQTDVRECRRVVCASIKAQIQESQCGEGEKRDEDGLEQHSLLEQGCLERTVRRQSARTPGAVGLRQWYESLPTHERGQGTPDPSSPSPLGHSAPTRLSCGYLVDLHTIATKPLLASAEAPSAISSSDS